MALAILSWRSDLGAFLLLICIIWRRCVVSLLRNHRENTSVPLVHESDDRQHVTVIMKMAIKCYTLLSSNDSGDP